MRWLAVLLPAAALAAPSAAVAELQPPGQAAQRPDAPQAEAARRPAAGAELFYSSDSDDTQVARAALDFDLRRTGTEYVGIRLEKAWFNPSGDGWQSRERVYLRAADTIGDWQWRAQVGTDGDTVLGSIAVNDNARFRKEFFVERDIVETRQGLAQGIYSTFAGAAVDLPVDDRNVFTALAGVQEFTGDNVRLHLRGNYIHVVKPDWGLSAQLRGRYFHSSDPGEFDYYSPRWFAELLPVAQVRRFVGGWELLGAAGVGVQRDSASDWRTSRYAHARFRSPAASTGWAAHGAFTYTNTPSLSGSAQGGYRYVQFLIGLSGQF